MTDLLLAIDEGTTSTRAMVFDRKGWPVATATRALTQHYPRPGWVEHDPREIWEQTLAATRAAIAQVGGHQRISAIGLTNQRETIVFWDKATGEPMGPAIVWQDRRTASICAELEAEGHGEVVTAATGLPIDPYFSATKMGWALKHRPELKDLLAAGRLAAGTVDSYLIFRLTGGLFVTDATNAARTQLMDLATCQWREDLCDLFGVPRGILPEIVDSAGHLGDTQPELFGRAIPICGVAGDQQAAAIGQACVTPGTVKATYGTGGFVLAHVGDAPRLSQNRLLATVAWRIDGKASYALEGSIFVAGSAVKWLRDQVGLVIEADETERLARSVSSTEGVYLVPAFVGLGAPYWRPDARALLTGLTFGATRAHIVRACLEAMSYQTHDLMRAFRQDGVEPQVMRIDGGMAVNDWMAQDLADMLGLTVERPAVTETTALGAAILAGAGCGMLGSVAEAGALWQPDRRFEPGLEDDARMARLTGWRAAVAQALGEAFQPA
ncbi:glycerol kinase GlpK [Pedomonas mirosovicensis]|uniref:glycerol kinase GlpK n=1 Tax=Pedomonas mirosovicensis TaxID=2908641 RepID=UPI00216A123A|nr:glycerol kinase GlpK [Pedomonas mirosovicensis]MCH8685292.1 glycerol kinase GlpK [Pedomonas mirosovicensis]